MKVSASSTESSHSLRGPSGPSPQCDQIVGGDEMKKGAGRGLGLTYLALPFLLLLFTELSL